MLAVVWLMVEVLLGSGTAQRTAISAGAGGAGEEELRRAALLFWRCYRLGKPPLFSEFLFLTGEMRWGWDQSTGFYSIKKEQMDGAQEP